MKIDLNNELRVFAGRVHSQDRGARIETIAVDEKNPVRFHINLPPMTQHLLDLRVDMSDEVKYPDTYWYAIMYSPFQGIMIIRFHKV